MTDEGRGYVVELWIDDNMVMSVEGTKPTKYMSKMNRRKGCVLVFRKCKSSIQEVLS